MCVLLGFVFCLCFVCVLFVFCLCSVCDFFVILFVFVLQYMTTLHDLTLIFRCCGCCGCCRYQGGDDDGLSACVIARNHGWKEVAKMLKVFCIDDWRDWSGGSGGGGASSGLPGEAK